MLENPSKGLENFSKRVEILSKGVMSETVPIEMSGIVREAAGPRTAGDTVEAQFNRACRHLGLSFRDIGHYCDAMQDLTVSQLLSVAMRHLLVDGDALAVMLYRPELIAPGRARYATSIQLIDPDRLSNPAAVRCTGDARGRRRRNFGAPQGYHIRRTHQGAGAAAQTVNLAPIWSWALSFAIAALGFYGRRALLAIEGG
jgi:hypothetical protein